MSIPLASVCARLRSWATISILVPVATVAGGIPIFGQAFVTLQSLQLMIASLWLFLMQRLTASKAFTSAFDRRHAFLNRLPTICLQTLSTTPDLTGNLRFR